MSEENAIREAGAESAADLPAPPSGEAHGSAPGEPFEERPAGPGRQATGLRPLHALLAVFVGLSAILLSGAVSLALEELGLGPLGGLVLSQLAFAGAALAVFAAAHGRLAGAVPLSGLTPPALLGSFLIGLSLLWLAGSTTSRLYQLVDSEEHISFYQETLAGVTSQVGPVGLFVLVAVLAPVCEELFFRGLLFRALAARWPLLPSMLVSSVLFGLIHGQVVHGLITFMLGVACCAALVITRSLWAPIVIHMANNSVVAFAPLAEPAAQPEVELLPWWLGLPALAGLALGFGLLLKERRLELKGTAP